MRRCDVPGILLILSIIDFALAVPVLGQVKHQAVVGDVVQIPKDVIPVLGERAGEEDYWKLVEDYAKMVGNPSPEPVSHMVDFSQPHAKFPPVEHVDSGSESKSDSLADSGNDWMYSPNSGDTLSPSPERVPSPERAFHVLDFSQPHDKFPPVNHVLPMWMKAAPSADPNFEWEYWMNVGNLPPLKPKPARPWSSRPSEARPSNPGPSNPGPSNPGPSNPGPSNPGPSNPWPPNPGPLNPWSPNPGPSDLGSPNPGPSNLWSPSPGPPPPNPGALNPWSPNPGPSDLRSPNPGPSNLWSPSPGPPNPWPPNPGASNPWSPNPGPSDLWSPNPGPSNTWSPNPELP